MSLEQQWSRINSVRAKRSAELSDLMSSEGNSSSIKPYRTLTKRLLFPAEIKQDEISQVPCGLILPESCLKTLWDLLSALCISCQGMTVPVFLAFEPVTDEWLYLDLAMLAFFTLDILFSFNLAFYELGALVTDRKRIASEYLCGWCFLDVMATLPLDMLFCAGLTCGNGTTAFIGFKLFRFTKVLRLLRLAKLNKIMFMLEDISSSQLIASCFLFLRLVFMLVIMAHWIACAWIFVGNINDSSVSNWLKASDLQDSSNSVIYITSLYWSLTTITSVGYGEIHAYNLTETYFVLVSMVVSSVIFAYLLGSITAFFVQQSASESLHREQVMGLSHFMKAKNLSPALRGRVKRYLEFVWELTRNSPLEKGVILPMLSKPLRNEIYAKTRGIVFSSCSVFEMQFSKQVTILSEQLKQQIFSPEDVVFFEGELSSTLYFIIEGVVDVFHRSSKSSYKRLSKSEHFGEIGFFSKMPRTASIRSLCFTELFSLDRCAMDEVCLENPDALIKLTLVQNSLIEGNLLCLGVNCYICNKLGHVAINCKSVLVINDKDKISKAWVQGRINTSKFVNLDKSSSCNFSRKKRDFHPVNVRSLNKTPVKIKIDNYLKTEFREELPSAQNYERPRYTFIIGEESDLENETYCEVSYTSPITKLGEANID